MVGACLAVCAPFDGTASGQKSLGLVRCLLEWLKLEIPRMSRLLTGFFFLFAYARAYVYRGKKHLPVLKVHTAPQSAICLTLIGGEG